MHSFFIIHLIVAVTGLSARAALIIDHFPPLQKIQKIFLCSEGPQVQCHSFQRINNKMVREIRTGMAKPIARTTKIKKFERLANFLKVESPKLKPLSDSCLPSLVVMVKAKDQTRRGRLCSQDVSEKDWLRWSAWL